ncbi:MAG: carboxypeptidase regulatory-like domain-containing protein [bacterium]
MKGRCKKVIGFLSMVFTLVQFSLNYSAAAEYSQWAKYKYSAPGAVLKMDKGDIDGDGVEETIAISAEGDEKKSPPPPPPPPPPAMPPKGPVPLGTLNVTVTPNPFDANEHTYVTFSNLPTKTLIMVYNEFDKMVWNKWTWNTSIYNWDVRDGDGNKLPSGNYNWIVIDLKNPADKAEGILTVQNVEDTKGTLIIRLLKFNNPEIGQLMDELRIHVDGIPLLTNLKVEDVDNDGKDEIIFSIILEKQIIEAAEYWTKQYEEMHGYVYVYGWDGNKLVNEYKSPDLLKDAIMFGLTIGDTDGDGKKEILIGITKVNKQNSDATSNRIDLLEQYLDHEEYFAAANLLHSGLLIGPLLDASMVKIECNGNTNFDNPSFHPAGPGLLYRLTAGDLDSDGTDTVVADVTDLNYGNMNKFIEDLGWAIAKAYLAKSPKTNKRAPGPTSEEENCSLFDTFTPVMGKIIETKEVKSIFPDSESAKLVISIFSKALFGEKQISKAKRAPSRAPTYYTWSPWHPWYGDGVSEELISWKEKLLIPEGTKIPDAPESLIDARIRLLNWTGANYTIKDSERVGIFTTNTKVTSDGKIVVKAVISNSPHANNLGNAIISNLVEVEEIWRERWVDPYSGEKRVDDEDYIALKNIPQLTGVFWLGKLHKFDANLNKVGTSQSFEGPFNSTLVLQDLDNDGSEEVIIGIGKFDYTKVNTIIAHLNTQWHLLKQFVQANKGDDFIPLPPDLPEDILTGGMAVYSATGTLIYSDNNLGDMISGIDALGNVNGDEEIAIGIVEVANLQVVNDYIDDWQAAISDVLTKRANWRAGSFTTFMNDLLPKIEQYNNWAIQWHNNGCQREWYTHPQYGYGYWPINPNLPGIDWLYFPNKPEVIKPADPTAEEIKSILTANIQTYKYGSSLTPSYQSPSLGHALTSLIAQNVDSTATTYLATKEFIAAGVDATYFIEDIMANVKDERVPETTIHVFKSPAPSGTGTLTGKVVNAIGDPIAGALVEIFKDTQSIGSSTTLTGGTYTIVANFPSTGTYTVKASYNQYFTTKTTTLWPQQINYLNFKIIDYTQWIKINGTTTATITGVLDASFTLTCNSYSPGGKVIFYMYFDEGAPGVLDLADWVGKIFFIEDNSHVDEDSTSKQIQITKIIEGVFTGQVIFQAVDVISGASAYCILTLTPNVLPQSISGTVTVDGNPQANMIVGAEGGMYGSYIFTDSNGQYTLYLPPGAYWVWAIKRGYPAVEQQVYLAPGSHTSNVNFNILTAGLTTITGRVTDLDGKGIFGAWVEAENDNEAFTSTNKDGYYTLYVKPGETYELEVEEIMGYTGKEEKNVLAGATNVDFTLTPCTATIMGTITGGDGVLGVYVEGLKQDVIDPWCETNRYGHYCLYVPAGSTDWLVHAHAESRGSAMSRVQANAGDTNVNLQLQYHNGTISGTVYAPDGTTTLGFVEVKALYDHWISTRDEAETLTNPDGTYKLRVLEGCRYEVKVEKEGYQSPPAKYATATATGVNFVFLSRATTIIYVDDDHPNADDSNPGTNPNYPKRTIQAGVNSCAIGGTVSVASGTYTESVSIRKKIALIGAGSNSTTIDVLPLGTVSAVYFDDDADGALISGFKINGAAGGYPDGCGIRLGRGTVTIVSNIITGNHSGIHCGNHSNAKITGNTVSGNKYGIYSWQSSPEIVRNLIKDNKSFGICFQYSSVNPPVVAENVIVGNNVVGGGSIQGDHCSPIIRDNIISESHLDGIHCLADFSPTIVNNIIRGSNSNGICCWNASPNITNNTIIGNVFHGIECNDNSSPTIHNNIIVSNGTTTTYYYGISKYGSGNPVIDYNCVWDNGYTGNQNYDNCTPGPNDISADPQFAGIADYHLQQTSPCIDRGSNTAPGIPATDKDGNLRIANGIVDMGAYEYGSVPPPPQYGTITGIIIYTGTKSGTLYYAAFDNPEFDESPVTEGTTSVSGTFTYNYSLQVGSGTYYMIAFIDTKGDGPPPSIGDPIGIYGNLSAVYRNEDLQITGTPTIVHVKAGSITSGIDFELRHEVQLPPPPGTITGTISYTGTKTGTACVFGCTDPFLEEEAQGTYTFTINGAGSYPFTIGNLGSNTYYIACWFDAEPPYGWKTEPSPGDILGLHGGTLTIIDGEPKVTGTPTPVVVEAGSISSGIEFSLDVVVPPLPRFPIPTAIINVDGTGTDWTQANIQPAGTDTMGDNIGPGTSTKLSGSDLKAVYIAQDNKNLYFRMDVYGTVNAMFQNHNSEPDRCGRYNLRIHTNANVYNNIEVAVVYIDWQSQWGIQAWDGDNDWQHIPDLEQQGTVTTQGGIIELALPLNILHHPSEFTIKPAVYYHYRYGFQRDLDRIQGFIAYQAPVNVDLKINGTTSATTVAGGTLTLTCNSSIGGRVEFYVYHDRGTIGVLDADDMPIHGTFFEVDNSHTDENPSIGQIKRTTVLFGQKTVAVGDFIIQAMDITTGSSSYASIKFTETSYSQSISGVVSLNGNPTADLIVVAKDGSDKPEVIAFTDTNGQYTLKVPVGSWKVTAQKIGYPSSKEKEVYVGVGSSTTLNFDISTIGLTTISGKVTCDGEPVKGVDIEAENEDEDMEVWVVTNDAGTYTLHVTPDKIWTLEARKLGYNSSPQEISVSSFPASNVNFVLTQNKATVMGTVTGSGGIFGAEAWAHKDGYSEQEAITNIYGHYIHYLPANSGKWHIGAKRLDTAHSVQDAYPGDKNVNLTLNWYNGTISGTVYAPDGTTTLGFVEVEAEMGYSELWDRVMTFTNPDGTYRLPVLEGCTYTVTAKKEGYESPATKTILASDTNVNFTMIGPELWLGKWGGGQNYGTTAEESYVLPGGTITYHIVYENKGGDAHNVTIVDTLPAGVTYLTNTSKLSFNQNGNVLTWQIGTMTTDETDHFKIIVKVIGTQTTFINVAKITTSDYEADTSDNQATWTTHIFRTDLAIDKSGPKEKMVGEEVTYQIEFENSGIEDCGSVTIRDILPVGIAYVSNTVLGSPTITGVGTHTDPYILSWQIGTINAGSKTHFNLTVKIGTDTTTKLLANVVEISGTEDGPQWNNRATWTTKVGIPDMSINKWGPESVISGYEIQYQINFDNIGEVTASNIQIIDTLPGSVTYISNTLLGIPTITGSGTADSPQILTWTVPKVTPDDFGYFNLKVKVGLDAIDTLTNVVKIVPVAGEKNLTNNQATWTITVTPPMLDLAVHKSAPNEIGPNETMFYRISYHNYSNVTLHNIEIKDTLPGSVTYLSNTDEWKVGTPAITGSGTTASPQVLTWCIKDISPFSSDHFYVNVKTGVDVHGVLSNKVEITKLPNEVKLYDNEESVSTTVVPPITDLYIDKWAPDRIIRGDELIYFISYGNRSRIDAYGVEIIDELPSGVTYSTNTLGIEPTIDGKKYKWHIGTINKWYGGHFNIIVTTGTFTPEKLINTVTITTLTREERLHDNKSIRITNVEEPYFDLAISKYHYPGEALIGKETSYTINYRNIGNIPVGSVTIKDTLPPDVRYVSNTVFGTPTITGSGTAQSPYELIWNIGTVAPTSWWGRSFGLTVLIGTKTIHGEKLHNVVEIDTLIIGTDPDISNNRATCTIEAVAPAADLSIRKWTVGGNQFAPGEVVTYIVSYANYGNIPAQATITDTYTLVGTTSGITYVGVEGIGSPTSTENLLTWKLGTINPSWYPNYFYLKIRINEDAEWPGTLTNEISITTDTFESNEGNNGSTMITKVVKPVVDLRVNKWGRPYEVLPGEKVVYDIEFQNLGNTDAGNVVLRDILPPGLSYFSDTSGKTHTITGSGTTQNPYILSWDYGTITMKGWRERVIFQLTSEVGTDTTPGIISNVVEISTSATETAYWNNTSTCTNYVVKPEVDLKINKYAPKEAIPGQEITYTIYYANEGNIPATNTIITDYLPDGVTYVSDTSNFDVSGTNTGTITWQIGTLSPGWYGFNVTVLVGNDSASGTILANVVEISSGSPDYHLNDNRATATTNVVVKEADLQVYKHASVYEALTGTEFTYHIRYRNTGNISATNTVITDYLPGSVTYVSDNSGFEVSGTNTGTITWQVGTISPGWWEGFNLRVKLGTQTSGSTTLTNVVEISSPTSERNPANNRATITTHVVEPKVDLTINKWAVKEVGLGQRLIYHITYRNMNRGEAGSVTITDYLPAEVSYVNDTSDFPCTVTTGNQVIWQVGNLPAWSRRDFKLVVQVGTQTAASSTLTNVIVINTTSHETDYSNNQATTTTIAVIPTPDLSIHKWGIDEVTAGQQMEYNLRCINEGIGKAYDVKIRDILPEGVIYVGNTGGLEPATETGNIIVWSIGELLPDESKFFKVRANVGYVPASYTLVNVAEITTITDEDNLTNNRSTFTIHVVDPKVELSIYKFGPRNVLSGGNIEYTITYRNHSASDAINSTITDTLASALSYVSNTSGTEPTQSGNQLIFPVGTIPAWYAGSFKLIVTNSAPASTTLTNIIEIESSWEEDNMTNNRATITTHVEEPEVDLKVHKWGEEARPGFKKIYHISYSNEGTEVAGNIALKDTLPKEVEYLSSNPQGSYDTNLHAVIWDISELQAQKKGNATIEVRVPVGTPLGLDLYNTIEISTSAKEKDYANNKFIEIETVVGSIDPNDKLASPQRYIKPGQIIDYTIRCENVATATANAILITIIDRLNPDYFDLSSMIPGEVGIGGVVYSSIDEFNNSGRGSLTFTYDSNSGTITWYFDFWNNANGLPPNVTSPEGEGYVKFSVKVKDNLAGSTEIKNDANIQFDYNPWIPTPPVVHVIDLVPPTSTVTPLAPTQSNVAFEVSWAGTDTTTHGTSGAISSYDIYVSDNGGSFTLWLKETTGTSATFRKGVLNHTYSFRSVAKDMAGNVETKVGSDTSTTIVAAPIFKVNPATKTVSKGDTFTMDIELCNAPGFTTLEPHLTFNPTVLEVKGISQRDFPEGGSVLGSQYNNTNGTIDYGVGLLTGSDSGTGTIITITFEAKAIGAVNIAFDTAKTLLLYEIESMFFQAIDGAITVKGTGTGMVEGYTMFDIPRKGTHSGIEVMIEGTNWGTTTDANGYFSFPNVVPGIYGTISTYVPGASPRIWKDVTIIPGVNTLGTLTLLNADANGDFIVNAFDFGYLRMAYFKDSHHENWYDTGTHTRNGYINSDFSGDSYVNAYDFGVLRMNYFKTGSETQTKGLEVPNPAKTPAPLNGATILKIVPSPKDANINEEFTLQVRLEDVPDFTSVDLRLCFNPTILEVATVTQGGFPEGGGLIKAEFDNVAGKIDYGVGLISGTDSGSGTVANITFKAKNKNGGTVSFSLTAPRETVILNNITSVPFTPITGTVTVTMDITSITHDATKPLKAGEILTVTLVGDANGTATFDIGTLRTNLPMMEIQLGTYTGTYTVLSDDNVTQATITGHLQIASSTVSKDADVKVTFDTISPALTITAPGTTDTGIITINVTANETIGTPTLIIKDSANATITATFIGVSNGTYSYQATITSANADGTATIKAEGTDLAGNIGTATTTFQISIPRKVEIVDGNEQKGTVTATLAPFVVKVTDDLNRPIVGHTVKWEIVSAPSLATLSSTITTTNPEGKASTTLTLGTKTGTYIVTAQGSMKATFTATATPGTLTQISIYPDSPFITVNQTFPFLASGYDQYNNEIEGLIYNWAKEGDIGTLNPLTGTSTILTATSTPTIGTISAGTQGVTGSTKVSIVYGQLTSVTITPATATVEMKGSQSFTAQGFNQYGYPIHGATYTWTLAPEIGNLDATTTQTVVFTATNTGSAVLQVTAQFGTQTVTATAKITVVKGNVHHINIEPATATIEARGTKSFTAKAYNQYNYELAEITNFVWQIVEGSGTIKGSPGQTVVLETNDVVGTLTLTAATNTVPGTAAVTVIHGSVTSVSITPTTSSVEVASTKSFTASAVNRFGHPIPASELSYTWQLISDIGGSITPTAISATTTFTAGSKTGRVDITAEAEGKRGTATVVVNPGQVEKLAFVQPTEGTLTTGMPGTMTIQTQDRFGNSSPATVTTTIIVTGDDQSRFAPSPSDVAWSATGTFTIVAGTSSKTFFFKQNGTTTPVVITATITGTNIFATYSVTILRLGSSSSGTVIGDDGKTKVEVGSGSLTGAGYIEIDITPGTTTAIEEANKKDELNVRINRVEGTLRKFTMHNGSITTTVRIVIPYPDANNDNYVDGVTPLMRVASLRIYKLVGTNTAARWQEIPSQVDTINKAVWADVSSFSFLILMGFGFEPTLEKAFVYPNPYYADRHDCIYFDRLTENSVIRIFTIAGELVKEIRVESSPQKWDVRNESGNRVASGIYIYLIKDPAGNKKVGKLGILR